MYFLKYIVIQYNDTEKVISETTGDNTNNFINSTDELFSTFHVLSGALFQYYRQNILYVYL